MRSRFATLLVATAVVACSTVPAAERGSDAAPIGRGEASDDSMGPALWRAQGSALVVREARVASPGWSAPSGHEMVSGPDRFEQRWRFDAREADGPLVVEVPIEGARAATVDDAGLHLVGSSGLWLHGHGTWVDAAGRRSHVPVEAGPLGARLVVPEAVLARTRFPAWLDPVVSREPRIGDPPLIGGASPTRPLAIGFVRGVGGVMIWTDASSHGFPLLMQRMDATGRPLDAMPELVSGEDHGWASVAFNGAWLLAWLGPRGLTTRRLDVDGRWIDPAPRELPGIRPGYDSRLVATSAGFLIPAWSSRGSELIALDPTGSLLSRRRVGVNRLACGGPAAGCLLVSGDSTQSSIQRVDEAGRPRDAAPRLLPPGFVMTDLAYSAGRFLVVGWTVPLRPSFGAVRVLVDGTVVDPVPIDLGYAEYEPEVHPAPRGWLVLSAGRPPQSVAPDGTVETWAATFPSARYGFRAVYEGARWLALTAHEDLPARLLPLHLDGTIGAPIQVADRYADVFDTAIVASDGSRYFAAWLESVRPSVGPFIVRTTILSPDGFSSRPPVELGITAWWNAHAAASGTRFVLSSGNELWVFEADGTLRSGPHPVLSDGLGCSATECMLQTSTSRTPFNPELGTLGTTVADTTHPLASGPAGHLELWTDAQLLARRIAPDGRALDPAPFVVAPVGAHVASATPTGWAVLHKTVGGGYGFSRIDSDGTVTDFGHTGLAGHVFTELSCGADTCWLESTSSWRTWLTILNDTGGVVGGPTLAPEHSSAPVALGGSTALATQRRYATSLPADRLFALVFHRDLPDGEACHLDAECTSGHCADGVCCDSACTGVDDCMACSVAAGSSMDGRCEAISAGWTCREAVGDCDVSESCDGLGTTCPPDAHVAAGTTCRLANGPCDVPDACDGTSSECVNAFVAAGMICRLSTDACDAEEACDGLMGLCEADWARPATEVCRASVDACDAVERCDGVAPACPLDRPELDGTACRDGDVCNGDEQCLGGACVPGTPLDCDDADWCSLDRCDAVRGCQYAPREPCCHDDIECDDSDSCTVDGCVEGGCRHEAREGCCRSVADCDDGDPCTRDQCIAEVCRRTRLCDRDAGPPPDAGAVEEPVDAGGARAPAGGGCACTAASPSASALSPRLLALALFALLARARRRRSRAQRTQGIEPSS